jgi:hypothetical protein
MVDVSGSSSRPGQKVSIPCDGSGSNLYGVGTQPKGGVEAGQRLGHSSWVPKSTLKSGSLDRGYSGSHSSPYIDGDDERRPCFSGLFHDKALLGHQL